MSGLDELMRMWAEQLAKQEDTATLKQLSILFSEPHFVKWFKTHYDFYRIVQPSDVETHLKGDRIVLTQRYQFHGPTYIPFGIRMRRRLRDWLRGRG